MNLKEQAEALGIKIDGRWSDRRIQEEIDKSQGKVVTEEALDTALAATFAGGGKITHTTESMNDLARRIWEGQSVSLPKKQRIHRIVIRLKDKGYTDEEIENLSIG